MFLTFTWKYGRVVSQSTRVKGVQYIEEDYDRLIGQEASAELPNDWQELEIEGLQFHFESREDDEEEETGPAVDIDSLTLKKGVRYAVVGESGGGKTTFLTLLRGLNQPDQQPSVRCDGKELPHGLHHINHHTTLIPQNPEIFSDTIRFNVTVGIPCPDERVLEALTLASAGEGAAAAPHRTGNQHRREGSQLKRRRTAATGTGTRNLLRGRNTL